MIGLCLIFSLDDSEGTQNSAVLDYLKIANYLRLLQRECICLTNVDSKHFPEHAKLHQIHTIEQFEQFTLTFDSKYAIVYYSGHGQKDRIVFPDSSKYPALKFREKIFSMFPTAEHITCMMDCCQTSGLRLPFIYKKFGFRLQCIDTIIPTQRRMLLLAATTPNTIVTARAVGGSAFTAYLTELLIQEINSKESNLTLEILREKIDQKVHQSLSNHLLYDGNPTMQYYSSHFMRPELPSYLFGCNFLLK